MDEIDPYIGMFICFAFLIMNTVLYGFSAAIQNINSSIINKRIEEDSVRAKKILTIINDPNKFINTVQVASQSMAMVLGIYGFQLFANAMHRMLGRIQGIVYGKMALYAVSYILIACFIIFIILTICVNVPKKVGAKNPERWAFSTVMLVNFIVLVMTPVTVLIHHFSMLIVRLFGIDPNEENENVTEEDIMSMVNEGHEQGVLLASEAEMITNIFEFGDKEAKDIMTHRKNIISVDAEWSLKETVRFISKENISRFPICLGGIDNIIGILHLRDAMSYNEKEDYLNWKIKDIQGLFRTPHFIPETKGIHSLFKDMQSKKNHIEIVIDEYGQTAGLVAMEDILEEIVGNILDEYDEEENNIILSEDGSYIIEGLTMLEEIEEITGITYDEDEYDTINGFLISKLDKIPIDGEKLEVTVGDCYYEVIEVKNKMISKVKMIKQ